MSLTNDMLKNLEKNRGSLRKELTIDDLHAAPIQSAAMKNTMYFALSVLTMILAFDLFHYETAVKTVSTTNIPSIKITIPKTPVAKPIQTDKSIPATDNIDNLDKSESFKTPAAESIEDKADQDYQDALSLIAKNHINQAITKLENIVSSLPEDLEARIALGTLLLQNNDPVQAGRVLQEGLSYQPGNPDLTTLYARALISQESYADAERVLQSASSTLANDTTYLELTATVDQHIGKPEEAVKIYEKLLSMDPTKGRYLIDLGISLEKAKSPNEAILIYKKALTQSQLPFDLQSFATTRIAALGGR